MKRILSIIAVLFTATILSGSGNKATVWKYELPLSFYGEFDSIPTINQFGQVRNGIIVDNIISVYNADPNGVDLTNTQIEAFRMLVGGMYTTGTWQKCRAIYPFIGGSEYKHKWNIKDLRDLDAAFRLSFINTVAHSSSGIKGNATSATFNNNGVVNTHYNPSLNNSTNFLSYFIYNFQAPNSSFVTTSFGTINGISVNFQRNFFLNRNLSKVLTYKNLSFTYSLEPPFSKFTSIYQNSSGTFLNNNFINKTPFTQTTVSDGINAFANGKIHLLCRAFYSNGIFTSYDNPSDEGISFFSILDGEITQTQSIQATNIVTQVQRHLSRQ